MADIFPKLCKELGKKYYEQIYLDGPYIEGESYSSILTYNPFHNFEHQTKINCPIEILKRGGKLEKQDGYYRWHHIDINNTEPNIIHTHFIELPFFVHIRIYGYVLKGDYNNEYVSFLYEETKINPELNTTGLNKRYYNVLLPISNYEADILKSVHYIDGKYKPFFDGTRFYFEDTDIEKISDSQWITLCGQRVQPRKFYPNSTSIIVIKHTELDLMNKFKILPNGDIKSKYTDIDDKINLIDIKLYIDRTIKSNVYLNCSNKISRDKYKHIEGIHTPESFKSKEKQLEFIFKSSIYSHILQLNDKYLKLFSSEKTKKAIKL
jgi:hypothetical protein